ncbi:hypothetical protein [Microbacterium sp. Root280D1]|uniref:hypothetical protein n=1 Tax=Microbacterium sp. Root280D1 TaxID=1736510 RepID=UPI0006F91853|nr:hypothetical protein [Microbacterium sp. Root280D1]KRD51950.1 hypothetical protein ASE34_08520 [Microbacterium sp. Root280D1]
MAAEGDEAKALSSSFMCAVSCSVDFLETFWATMWGALAGGAFGAFVAWLFALELRRREKRARDEEIALEQSARMRVEWADLAYQTERFRAWLRAPQPRSRFARLRHSKAIASSEQDLHDRIVRAGAHAAGPDAKLVELVGIASMAEFISREARIVILDEATQRLLRLAVTDPSRIAEFRRDAIDTIRAGIDAER